MSLYEPHSRVVRLLLSPPAPAFDVRPDPILKYSEVRPRSIIGNVGLRTRMAAVPPNYQHSSSRLQRRAKVRRAIHAHLVDFSLSNLAPIGRRNVLTPCPRSLKRFVVGSRCKIQLYIFLLNGRSFVAVRIHYFRRIAFG